MNEISQNVFVVLVGLFGLLIGSFLNVIIWRLPRKSNIRGRSECPKCKAELKWHDLIPVVSYILQRGKCRYCGAGISVRYPLIELITGILFAVMAMHFYSPVAAEQLVLIRALIVVSFCVAIFVVDLEHYLILDALVFPGIAAMLLTGLGLDLMNHVSLLSLSGYTASGLLGAMFAFIPFWLLWYLSKGRWMGFGDVKFVLFMGLVLGFPVIFMGLFLAFMSGALISMFFLVSGKKQLSSRIPFGTFLAAATVIALIWGERLWHWYSVFAGLNSF